MSAGWGDASQPLTHPSSYLGDQVTIGYDLEGMRADAERWRKLMYLRLISLVVSMLFWIGLQLWRITKGLAGTIYGWPYWTLVGVTTTVSVVGIVYAVLRSRQADRRLAEVTPDPPLIVGRGGVVVRGIGIGWHDLTGLTSEAHSWHGVQLAVTGAGHHVKLPFSSLDAAPSTIDDAVKAYSQNHRSVSLAAIPS